MMHSTTIVIPMADIEDDLGGESSHRPISKKDESKYRRFLSMSNPLLYQQYKVNQKRNFDVVAILPLLATFFVGVSTRLNLGNSFRSDVPGSYCFTAATAILLIAFIVSLLYFAAHMIIHRTPKDKRDSSYYRISEKILLIWFGGRIEDLIGILGVLFIGIYLVARVLAGQCADMDDIWLSQMCNPVAASASIPHDQVILLYSAPLLAQIVVKGISVEALTLSWLLIVIFVVYSIVLVNGWFQIWTILYVIIFINISYEFERLMRISFLHNREMLTAESAKRRSLRSQQAADTELMSLRSRHQIEISELSFENERRLRETESTQLRSLMGNVAHDLKTPLHSIEADLDVLFKFLTRIPNHQIQRMTEDIQQAGGGEPCDPQSIFDSLTATCKFMVMAINRSQDFMKTSNNIALVPVMETFSLQDEVDMSVTCINHTQTSRTIVVHRIPSELCSHIISDRHWLGENILCLLSNALKYSYGGTVDVRIRLTDVTALKVEAFMKKQYRVGANYRRISFSTPHDDSPPVIVPPTPAPPLRLVLVTVEDFGIGISEEVRSTLFQPFKQAQRMTGGTGLGLYCLLKRVEALGGMCGVGPRTDGAEGCIFWFSFPYRPDYGAADAEISVAPTPALMTPPESVLTPRRILLIDDSLSILKVVSRLLKLNGHTVDTASNGLLGLEKLKSTYESQEYDMVLTDLQMPVMDGIEATDRFRKFESEEIEKRSESAKGVAGKGKAGKRLLIVGMSANSDEQSKKDALETGMDYFFTKPFAYKDLEPILLQHQDQIEPYGTQ